MLNYISRQNNMHSVGGSGHPIPGQVRRREWIPTNLDFGNSSMSYKNLSLSSESGEIDARTSKPLEENKGREGIKESDPSPTRQKIGGGRE